MKSITSLSKRFRVSLTLLTALSVLPLGSAFQNAEAKPKAGAPAYGYRAKISKAQKRQNKRARRQDRRETRRDRRDDNYGDYRNGDYRNDDYRNDDYRNDDYRNDDYRNDQNSNYPVRNRTEDRIREYLGF